MEESINNIFKQKDINLNYSEAAIETSGDEFAKVVESRRSIRIYNDESIPEEVMQKCLDLTLLAPNSSNLQPWEFYWVRSAEKKSKLVEYCLGQPAAATAQELIVCVARMDSWKKHAGQILEQFESSDLPIPKSAEFYYKKLVHIAYTQGWCGLFGLMKKMGIWLQATFTGRVIPREPTSLSDMRVWAHKSCALACENLMLSLRAYGYDSCPMEGMDSTRVKKLLNIQGRAEICMVISAGKRRADKIYGPRQRLNRDQFVKIV